MGQGLKENYEWFIEWTKHGIIPLITSAEGAHEKMKTVQMMGKLMTS